MTTLSAQDISNRLVDAAYLVRADPSDVAAAIRGVEQALESLRVLDGENLSVMHGH